MGPEALVDRLTPDAEVGCSNPASLRIGYNTKFELFAFFLLLDSCKHMLPTFCQYRSPVGFACNCTFRYLGVAFRVLFQTACFAYEPGDAVTKVGV